MLIALTTSAAAVLLVAASRRDTGRIEAGDGDLLGGFSIDALSDRAQSFYNQITEEAANVSEFMAEANLIAFLAVLRSAEGTSDRDNPYAVCYGYSHTIRDFRDHPAITGEWAGVVLPDAMCRNAGFGPGCRSTAAGAYQLIRRSWSNVRDALGLPDFSPASQDAAAVELIRRRGALEDVKAGRFEQAVAKCRNEWASLPGNYAKQGQRSMATLANWYSAAGGAFA